MPAELLVSSAGSHPEATDDATYERAVMAMPPIEFWITRWRSLVDPQGERETLTAQAFTDSLRTPLVLANKRQAPGYSLAVFDGDRRGKSRMQWAYGAGIDYDSGLTSVDVADRFWHTCCGFIHTTHSHLRTTPRFRVVILFKRAVNADEFERIISYMFARAKSAGHIVDEAPRDPSRLWFVPSVPPGGSYELRELTGEPLDVDDILAKPAEKRTVEPSKLATLQDVRARRYIESALDRERSAVRCASPGERNDTLNRAAFALGQLVAGGALGEHTAAGALMDAAKGAGLAEYESARTIRSGLEAAQGYPRGVPDPSVRLGPSFRIGSLSESEQADARDETSDIYDAVPESGPSADDPMRGLEHLGPLALYGRARILEIAARPVHYVWGDIAVAGTIVVYAGGPGEGKTTVLFLLLAARLTTGGPVKLLGRFVEPVPRGKYVVLIEGEHSERSTGRKLCRSLELLDIGEDALDRVIILARKAVLIGSPAWGDVQRLVRAGLVSDIAIDTIARVAPAEANDEREQVAIFDLIAQTIEAAPDVDGHPTVWIVAHTRKGTGELLEDVSGSTQRVGQADSVILVKGERRDGQVIASRITFAKLREEPEMYPTPVDLAIVNGELRMADPADADDDDRPLETRITERLALGPHTKNKLSDSLGRSYGDIDAAISNLFSTRTITTTVVKVKGREFKAFALREGAPKDEQ